MATKSLKDLDYLQSSIKSIVKDAFEQVSVLQKDIKTLQEQNEYLTLKNKELTAKCQQGANSCLLQQLEDYQKKINTLCCEQCKEILSVGPKNCLEQDEAIQKELEELSSIEFESQFEVDSPGLVEETPSPSKAFCRTTSQKKPNAARNILQSMFAVVSPVPPEDIILADESPTKVPASIATVCKFVPDSAPVFETQRTPLKTLSPDCQLSPIFHVSPSGKKARVEISPYKPRAVQLLFSPMKPNGKKKSPRKKTPSKALKKTHRINTELTQDGVRKLSQTQLNLDCFRKARTLDESKPAAASPVYEAMFDMDETNLTNSAIRRLTDEKKVKREVFISSYDRIPECDHKETRKECRKNLPGLECQDCAQWYRHQCDTGNEQERRKLVDKFSRHRTKNVPLPDTPEGYWKPMLTPEQKD